MSRFWKDEQLNLAEDQSARTPAEQAVASSGRGLRHQPLDGREAGHLQVDVKEEKDGAAAPPALVNSQGGETRWCRSGCHRRFLDPEIRAGGRLPLQGPEAPPDRKSL